MAFFQTLIENLPTGSLQSREFVVSASGNCQVLCMTDGAAFALEVYDPAEQAWKTEGELADSKDGDVLTSAHAGYRIRVRKTGDFTGNLSVIIMGAVPRERLTEEDDDVVYSFGEFLRSAWNTFKARLGQPDVRPIPDPTKPPVEPPPEPPPSDPPPPPPDGDTGGGTQPGGGTLPGGDNGGNNPPPDPEYVTLTPQNPGTLTLATPTSPSVAWTTTVKSSPFDSVEWVVRDKTGAMRGTWATLTGTAAGKSLAVPFVATGDTFEARKPGDALVSAKTPGVVVNVPYSITITPADPGTIQGAETGPVTWDTTIKTTGADSAEYVVMTSAKAPRTAWKTVTGTKAGKPTTISFEATGDYLLARKPGDDSYRVWSTAVAIQRPEAPPEEPPPVDPPTTSTDYPTTNLVYALDFDAAGKVTVEADNTISRVDPAAGDAGYFAQQVDNVGQRPVIATKRGRKVAVFDGVDDGLYFPDTAIAPFSNSRAQRSLHAVVFTPATLPAAFMPIIGKQWWGGDTARWFFGLDGASSGRPRFETVGWDAAFNTVNIYNNTASVAAGDALYLMSFVEKADGTVQLYVNGTPVATVGSGPMPDADLGDNSSAAIGARWGEPDAFFKGAIAAILHYSSVHTDADVAALWKTVQARFPVDAGSGGSDQPAPVEEPPPTNEPDPTTTTSDGPVLIDGHDGKQITTLPVTAWSNVGALSLKDGGWIESVWIDDNPGGFWIVQDRNLAVNADVTEAGTYDVGIGGVSGGTTGATLLNARMGGITLDAPVSGFGTLSGVDPDTGFDWSTPLWGARPRIQYLDEGDTGAVAATVEDGPDPDGGTSARLRLSLNRQASINQVPLLIEPTQPVNEFEIRASYYLPPDVISRLGQGGWMSMGPELKTTDDFRIIHGVVVTGSAPNLDLWWEFKSDNQANGGNPPDGQVHQFFGSPLYNSSVAVPVGEWFSVKWYFKRHATEGRSVLTVNDQIVFDITGNTIGVNGSQISRMFLASAYANAATYTLVDNLEVVDLTASSGGGSFSDKVRVIFGDAATPQEPSGPTAPNPPYLTLSDASYTNDPWKAHSNIAPGTTAWTPVGSLTLTVTNGETVTSSYMLDDAGGMIGIENSTVMPKADVGPEGTVYNCTVEYALSSGATVKLPIEYTVGTATEPPPPPPPPPGTDPDAPPDAPPYSGTLPSFAVLSTGQSNSGYFNGDGGVGILHEGIAALVGMPSKLHDPEYPGWSTQQVGYYMGQNDWYTPPRHTTYGGTPLYQAGDTGTFLDSTTSPEPSQWNPGWAGQAVVEFLNHYLDTTAKAELTGILWQHTEDDSDRKTWADATSYEGAVRRWTDILRTNAGRPATGPTGLPMFAWHPIPYHDSEGDVGDGHDMICQTFAKLEADADFNFKVLLRNSMDAEPRTDQWSTDDWSHVDDSITVLWARRISFALARFLKQSKGYPYNDAMPGYGPKIVWGQAISPTQTLVTITHDRGSALKVNGGGDGRGWSIVENGAKKAVTGVEVIDANTLRLTHAACTATADARYLGYGRFGERCGAGGLVTDNFGDLPNPASWPSALDASWKFDFPVQATLRPRQCSGSAYVPPTDTGGGGDGGGTPSDPVDAENGTSPPLPSGMTLVFDSTFNSATLDRNKWKILYGGPSSNGAFTWVNENVKLADGIATVETRNDGAGWTSGGFATGGPGWKYGRFEVRARVDAGQGVGPAILLWPVANVWPPEVDILESPRADRSTVFTVNHWPDGTAWGGQEAQEFPVDATVWHTYTVDWDATSIRYYIDGVLKHTFTANIPQQEMQLGIQGFVARADDNWYGGGPNAATPNPHKLQVAYARIWQKLAGGDTGGVPAQPSGDLQAAKDFVADLTLGVNIERTKSQTTDQAFYNYLKQTAHATHIRNFHAATAANPSRGLGMELTLDSFNKTLDKMQLALNAGLKVFLDVMDLFGDQEYLDAAAYERAKWFAGVAGSAIASRGWDPKKIAVGAINEYEGRDNAHYKQAREELTTILRAKLPGYVLTTGPANWKSHRSLYGDKVTPLTPLADQRVIYDIHHYDAWDKSGWAWAQQMIDQWSSQNGGRPVVFGECGFGDHNATSVNPNDGTAYQYVWADWDWPKRMDVMFPELARSRPMLWAVNGGGWWQMNKSGWISELKDGTDGQPDLLGAFIRHEAGIRQALGL